MGINRNNVKHAIITTTRHEKAQQIFVDFSKKNIYCVSQPSVFALWALFQPIFDVNNVNKWVFKENSALDH